MHLLVPFASAWKPIPVALGIVAMYVLVTVEVTSLLQRHLPRTAWRQIHVASYGLFGFATLHALTAGTDVRAVVAGGLAYTAGAVIFAMRRPNPYPATFGYHEIFHVLVITAVACHYVAVAFFAVPRD